jgi:autotransporter-associated beta strand protein
MNSILSFLRSRFNTAAAALAAVLLATPAAHAASAAWLGTTDSLWSTAGNWSGSTIPGVSNTATFNGTGSGNTAIDVGTISLLNITFDTASAAAYTLGTGADTITLGTPSAVTMNSTVVQNETINANLTLGTALASATTFTNNSTTNLLTLGGNITGGTGGTAAAKSITIAGAGNTAIGGIISNGGGTSVSVNKTSTGTLTLSNANTYTGNTTVSGAGTLILGNMAALGTGGLIFQTAASTLQASTDLSGGNATTNVVTLAFNTTVSGSNNITLGGNFTNSGGSRNLTSSLDAGKVFELSGNVFLSNNATARTLTIAGTGNTTISGVIADSNGAGGSSNFAVTNTGVTTLTNANTYTGSTQVNADAATLRLSGAGKIVGSVLATAGTLDFNGTTQTITTLQLGGASGSTANVLIGDGILNLGGTVSYLSTNNPNGGTISGEGGGVLNLNAPRTFTIGDSTAAANDLTVSAIIADGTGSNGITKGSPGVLALTGANTYTGITTISAAGGTISVSNLKNGGVASSLGMSSNATTNLVLGNATTLAYTGTGDTTDRLFTIFGAGNGLGATLEASGSGDINFSNTGSLAFTTANQTRTLTLTGTNVGNNILAAALANNGSGATSLAKTGVGTWALSGTSTYTGATTVSGGILTFLKTSAKSSGSAVTAGAAGTIGLGVGGAGYYSSAQVASLFNTSLAGFTMNATSGVAIDTSAGNFTQTDALTAGRALTKLGANTLTLTAANTYTGTTTVSVGTLLVNNTTGNGTGTGSLSVSSGAILGGSGTIAGAVSVAGTLAPGNSPANLTVSNSVTILDGGTLSMEIAGPTVGTEYDRLTMTGVGSVFSLNGTNNLALSLTYSPANNALFFLVDNQGGSALSGVFEKLNGTTTNLADGAQFNVSGQDFKISYFGNVGTNSFTGGDDLVIQAVPEPGTWLLLAATGTFFMVMRRRRM